jgi:acylphosphatase
MHQLNARFSGRVQGVGFRMTVAEIAESFRVAGRVCNMHDGSVRLVAQGEEAELLKFHQAIVVRMGHYLVDHAERWSIATGGCCAGFEIAADDSL